MGVVKYWQDGRRRARSEHDAEEKAAEHPRRRDDKQDCP
jgi:hypothetical protein